MIHIPINQSSV